MCPSPRFLADELTSHVAAHAPDDLVFPGVTGGALRAQSFQRTVLTEAAEHLGLGGLDEVAERMDAAARADGYPLCTRASVTPIGGAQK